MSPRATLFDAYQQAFYQASTYTWFREFNPVRRANTFVYTSAGSGGIGATVGEVNVSKFAYREIHYQVRVLNSASMAFQIEGRAGFFGTHTQLKRFTVIAAQASWPSATIIPNKGIDFLRVGVRSASPSLSDLVSVYGMFK